MKYGVIDVGGGLRGIYGAGVLDRCLEEDLRFDLCIGVSAGSANMASYLAGQHGRNKPFYDEYSFRREYMSVHNLIRKHSYLDLGYVYGTLSNAGGENPLDYATTASSWRPAASRSSTSPASSTACLILMAAWPTPSRWNGPLPTAATGWLSS